MYKQRQAAKEVPLWNGLYKIYWDVNLALISDEIQNYKQNIVSA